MKSIKIVSLRDAKVGDVVEIRQRDVWRNLGELHIGFLLHDGVVKGFVTSVCNTALHEHPYLIVTTAYGKCYVKKGGW